MEKKRTVWIVTVFCFVWMNGIVLSAEPLKPDLRKATVSGVRVVSQCDGVWQLQGTQVNPSGSAGTMTNSWGYATFPSATRDLAKDGYFILYPEKVACPAMEILSLGEDYEPLLNHCCSYWDMHWGFTPLNGGRADRRFKAGDAYRMKFRVRGYPPVAADKLAAQSQLLPILDPKSPPEKRVWRLRLYVMENDPDALMARVVKDFPNRVRR